MAMNENKQKLLEFLERSWISSWSEKEIRRGQIKYRLINQKDNFWKYKHLSIT